MGIPGNYGTAIFTFLFFNLIVCSNVLHLSRSLTLDGSAGGLFQV